MTPTKAIKIYIDRNAYVRLPVDQHWIQIAQTVTQHYNEWNEKHPDGDTGDDEHPWNQHWSDMMAPRYYAHQCVEELLGNTVDFDFDDCNDWLDMEDAMFALAEGRPDPMLVELEAAQ